MRQTIDLLFALQQLDDEIDDLRDDEEAIPEKKEELRSEVGEIEARLKASKQEGLDLAKVRRKGRPSLRPRPRRRPSSRSSSSR